METTKEAPRPLYEIGDEIRRVWKNPYFGAQPYISAMQGVQDIFDSYGEDPASHVVNYFLSNAGSWRGEDARRIKAELRGLLADHKKGVRR